jgi:hypothetical protein
MVRLREEKRREEKRREEKRREEKHEMIRLASIYGGTSAY